MEVAPTVTLNNGLKFPMVGLGTYSSTSSKNKCKNAVIFAIQNGYRHIDTASFYNNEEEIGEGIASCINEGIVTREELFVVTKLWNDEHAEKQVLPALKRSLKKLKLEYVDLYLIHWPVSDNGIDILETWLAMEELQRQGLAKSIGVSNFNEAQIDRVCTESSIKPAVNQIEVSPQLSCVDLVNHCQKKDIVVTAYCPLGTLPESKKSGKNPLTENNPTLKALSLKYGKTAAQIVLRFLIQRGLVVIPKSYTNSRIKDNISVFDFELTNDEVQQMLKLNTNNRIIAVSFWKTDPNYPF